MARVGRPVVARSVVAGAIVAWVLVLGCKPPPGVRITSPQHGSFLGASTGGVLVSGVLEEVAPNEVAITVNGVAASIDSFAKTFSAIVPLAAGEVFQPIVAEMTQLANGAKTRDRVVVLRGDGASEADQLPEALAVRLPQSGLDEIAPVAAALIQEQLDLATLLPTDPFAVGDASVQILHEPEPSYSGLALAIDAKTGRVGVHGVLDDVFVKLKIDRNALFDIHCTMEIRVPTLNVVTSQRLTPSPDGERIDVQQVTGSSEVVVTMPTINSVADCSQSGWFVARKEKAVRDKIQGALGDALAAFLKDPDGEDQPDPAPIATALADQLARINVTGVTIPGLRSRIDASFARITQDAIGVEAALDVDASPPAPSFEPVLGRVAALRPRPDPDLSRSLIVPSGTPPLATLLPNDVALGVSFSGLNRLLMSETEMRRFEATISELAGEPLTAASLAPFLPELASLPPETPLRVKIKPTLAPILTGQAGPHGELVDARIAQLVVTLVKLVTANGTTTEGELLRVAIDARVGIDVALGEDGLLSASLGAVAETDFAVHVLANPLGTNQDVIEVFGPILLASELPTLVQTTASLPLPGLLGLEPHGTQVLRQNGYLVLLADLSPLP